MDPLLQSYEEGFLLGGSALWQTLKVGTSSQCSENCDRVPGTQLGYRLMNEQSNAKNVVFFSGLGWPIQSTIQ